MSSSSSLLLSSILLGPVFQSKALNKVEKWNGAARHLNQAASPFKFLWWRSWCNWNRLCLCELLLRYTHTHTHNYAQQGERRNGHGYGYIGIKDSRVCCSMSNLNIIRIFSFLATILDHDGSCVRRERERRPLIFPLIYLLIQFTNHHQRWTNRAAQKEVGRQAKLIFYSNIPSKCGPITVAHCLYVSQLLLKRLNGFLCKTEAVALFNSPPPPPSFSTSAFLSTLSEILFRQIGKASLFYLCPFHFS